MLIILKKPLWNSWKNNTSLHTIKKLLMILLLNILKNYLKKKDNNQMHKVINKNQHKLKLKLNHK